jgi:plastocyanin
MQKAILILSALIIVALSLSAACSSKSATTPSTATTLASTTTTTGQGVTVNLIASGMAFNMGTITVPAGVPVTVNFNNQDNGTAHNFSVYTNSSAATSLFVGTAVTGPATTTYKFTAPITPGSYFFRCDIHPTVMTGTFVVTA